MPDGNFMIRKKVEAGKATRIPCLLRMDPVQMTIPGEKAWERGRFLNRATRLQEL